MATALVPPPLLPPASKKQGGDLRCPSWISTEIQKLIGRLLDPNLPPEKSCKSYAMDGRQGQRQH
jgi:hypothetical protein